MTFPNAETGSDSNSASMFSGSDTINGWCSKNDLRSVDFQLVGGCIDGVAEYESDRILPLSTLDDDAEVTDESDDIKDAVEGTLKNTPSVKPSSVYCFLFPLVVDVVGRAFSVRLEDSAPTRLSIRFRIICRMIWKRLDLGVDDVMIVDCTCVERLSSVTTGCCFFFENYEVSAESVGTIFLFRIDKYTSIWFVHTIFWCGWSSTIQQSSMRFAVKFWSVENHNA